MLIDVIYYFDKSLSYELIFYYLYNCRALNNIEVLILVAQIILM